MQPEVQEILDELKFRLFADKEVGLHNKLSCNLVSAMFANLFLSHKNKSKVFIIESTNHAVVYDGKDTWDINLGFVLRNYCYPEKHIPTLEFLPHFKHWYQQKWFDTYYSSESRELAKNNILVKELKIIGVINGTKEEKGRKAY